jgi:hypothetical protein
VAECCVYYYFIIGIFMLSPVDSLKSDYKAIEDCRNNDSLSDISPDAQERVLALLAFSPQKPETLWDAIGHLHFLALKARSGVLASRLATCAQPYLGNFRPNINLLITDKAQKHFSSLDLAQIPFFTNLFNGSYTLKWDDNNRPVINDIWIKTSSLNSLMECIQGRRNDFLDFGIIKLGWFMQHMDYFYAGFQNAPELLRQKVVAHLISIAAPENIEKLVQMADAYRLDTVEVLAAAVRTGQDLKKCSQMLENDPKHDQIMDGIETFLLQRPAILDNFTSGQLLNYYSIASYFKCEDLMYAALATLSARVQTPAELQDLWSLVDSQACSQFDEDCVLLNSLSKHIQLRSGPYDRDVANWAYARALLYEQSQWGRALASSLVDLNDEFAFGNLEGAFRNNFNVLTVDLDYATTQYLLKRIGEWLNIIGDRFDIDGDVAKRSRKITALEMDALTNLRRFAAVAHRVTDVDQPFLQGVSQKKLSWLFSKLNPDQLKSTNLDESHISDTTILHPFNNLTSLSLKGCLSLRCLDLMDTMPGLKSLDLSNCVNLNWKIGYIAPKPMLVHLLLENVSVGDPREFSRFPQLKPGSLPIRRLSESENHEIG